MNLINAKAQIGDYVAFPTQAPNQGLGMAVGYIEEIREDTGKIRIKPVYSTTRKSRNKDGSYSSQAVLASLCVRVIGWNGDIR